MSDENFWFDILLYGFCCGNQDVQQLLSKEILINSLINACSCPHPYAAENNCIKG